MNKAFTRFLNNLTTLLMALVLATVIWVNAVREANPTAETSFQVPVRVVARDDGIILNELDLVEEVEVDVVAPQQLLDQIREEIRKGDPIFEAVVDLNGVGFGRNEVPITLQYDSVTYDQIDEIRYFPQQTTVEMDQQVTKEIPIRVESRGSVARTHNAEEPIISPEIITVTGPAARVNAISEARVSIFLNDTTEDMERTLRPLYYDRQGNALSLSSDIYDVSHDEINVTIPVVAGEGVADVAIRVTRAGQQAEDYRVVSLVPTPRTVLLRGAPEDIAGLRIVFTEEVDLTGLKDDKTQRVELILPENITLAEDLPQLTVDIDIEPIVTTNVFKIVPNMIGLGEELAASLTTEEVNVILTGPREALNTLTLDDVRVDLDLVGLDVGIHEIEPNATQPLQSVTIDSVEPSLLTVEITEVVFQSDPSYEIDLIRNRPAITPTDTLTNSEAITGSDTITNSETFRTVPHKSVASKIQTATFSLPALVAAAPLYLRRVYKQ